MSLAEIIFKVYRDCASQHHSSSIPQVLRSGPRRFIGVSAETHNSLDFSSLRSIITSPCTEGNPQPPILEVVGDSGTPFDNTKSPDLRRILAHYGSGNTFLEYGFTCSEYDANWLVGDYVSRTPEIASRIVANVVGQSTDALESNDWTGSEDVTTFIVLYREDGTLTKFGEDTWLSDGILSAKLGDRILCLEGGPQTFHQCVNALTHGIEVIAVTGVRSSTDSNRFSAAGLLVELQKDRYDIEIYLSAHQPRTEQQSDAIRADILRLLDLKDDFAQLVTNTSFAYP